MLPLDEIKKYYPKSTEEELKEIQEVVYLLSCAIMQEFYGPPVGEPRHSGGSDWMGDFEESGQEGK
ncbi:MAG: hypothetical protein UT54_C0006G0029 [Candidatus Daviesbacteria bacterium GW2011_GWB1_39_5]|uniref:Uncharacterized protein n=1 Tax=Candidatus Daviesbacteria bacterium GW2011_GWC2_40_12 TaxID=1618431 RepID=A0A0G0QKX6_9BACT|nr:MAG: hypothetical protein UT45_C0004G0060 [Candidatus Daviesbacteria bacterium GW2011_GWA2_39_33]KKR25164.1 MAG: hypothetical protein UT54_C0006G0029 [Candidatus Daviesbacteria bacterium GW2011_GWB1_39_5]KKR41074.1 MAG: hypothetical protein UT77_C0016G0028 [Candidatus Daviesbacteria bacterium GW2011_GWC2_40_12]OGE28487.1 MAG: hypothetical protein A3C29_05975 [Candidatus Daviesbacteria bacterium RIFCSPHIGHO2_02_FULL_40_16]OGE42355.1 MAG: hypothetical protein A3A53_01235 [Candidatus Daviesbact